MEITITSRWTDTGLTQQETYSPDLKPDAESIEKYAIAACDNFNRGQGQGDPKKELIHIEVKASDSDGNLNLPKWHNWKTQDGVKYRCAHCGATGSRKEVNGPIKRDPRYNGDRYKFCPEDQEAEKVEGDSI